MTKIRKLKRKKKYRVNVNRKRLRNKQRKLERISCDPIQNAWEVTKSIRTNLKEMGLAYDSNKTVKIPNVKLEMLEDAKAKIMMNEELSDHEEEIVELTSTKYHIAQQLEAEAKMPRKRLLKLPKGQVQFLTYLIEKYNDDFEAMSRDKKNHYQLTWKQIRAKIKLFKGIPDQYNEYFQNKNILH